MGTTGFHKKEAKNWAPSTSWGELFASLDDFNVASSGRAACWSSILSSKCHGGGGGCTKKSRIGN